MSERTELSPAILPLRRASEDKPLLNHAFRLGSTRVTIRVFRQRLELTVEALDGINRHAA